MPQQGGDLVSAGYPTSRPLTALLGGLTQTQQPNVPARSNLELFGGVPADLTNSAPYTAAGAFSYAVATVVPVVPGDVFTQVRGAWGNGAASLATHFWSSLYAGTPTTSAASPALIGSTVDYTGSIIGSSNFLAMSGSTYASNAPFAASFSTPQVITSINAPYGWIYVSLAIYAGSSPLAPLSVSTGSTTIGAPQLFSSTGPAFLSATHALGASVAATNLTGFTRTSYSPIVILT